MKETLLVQMICCESCSLEHGQVALTQMQPWCSGGCSLFLTLHQGS